MTEDNETIEDILAELRERGECRERSPVVYDYANRIEAAHKRELETKDSVIQTLSAARDDELDRHRREVDALKQRCAELGAEVAAKDVVIKRMNDAIAEDQRRKMAAAENSSAVGDTAKLREALKATLGLFFDIHNANRSPQSNQAYAVIRKIKAALAAPPRNCDAGTAEEQLKRFKDFCRIISKEETCDGCPLLPQCSTLEHCTLNWAQMPYEERGAKMSGKIRNPARRCKICGGKCKKQFRYCKLCTKERKQEAQK